MERRRWLGDLLAGPAGELLPHRLDHLPLARDDLQCLGDVLAELGQPAAADRARAGSRNNDPLARQMGRTVGAGAWRSPASYARSAPRHPMRGPRPRPVLRAAEGSARAPWRDWSGVAWGLASRSTRARFCHITKRPASLNYRVSQKAAASEQPAAGLSRRLPAAR